MGYQRNHGSIIWCGRTVEAAGALRYGNAPAVWGHDRPGAFARSERSPQDKSSSRSFAAGSATITCPQRLSVAILALFSTQIHQWRGGIVVRQ